MKQQEVLREIDYCLRSLDASYSKASVCREMLEDAMFFFERGEYLYIDGNNTFIAARDVECIRFKKSYDRPIGSLVIYFVIGEENYILSVHLNRQSEIDGFLLSGKSKQINLRDIASIKQYLCAAHMK